MSPVAIAACVTSAASLAVSAWAAHSARTYRQRAEAALARTLAANTEKARLRATQRR